MKTFGETLKRFRTHRSLTQAEFGRKVQLSRSQVSNLETSFNEPDLESLDRIATFFNVSVDTLMGRKTFSTEKQLESVLDEVQTVFAGLDETQREHFCKQLTLYTRYLNTNKDELL